MVDNSETVIADGISSNHDNSPSRRLPVFSQTRSRSSASLSQPTSRSSQPGSRYRYFRSRRVQKTGFQQPWLGQKDPREKWITIIPLIGILIGLGVTGLLAWDGARSVSNHKYCPVLIETNFRDDLRSTVWTKESEIGGFGNGQFEETTAHEENVFVQAGILYIKPTVRDISIIENNGTFTNLLKAGTCSSKHWSDCVIHTNLSNGTIINPVASARISTKTSAKIKYGRVEVQAKLPKGDWIWPAIWMLPADSKYGEWPRSGEIDIMESRGNNYTYAQGGNNIISSSIHWGLNTKNDGWWRNHVKREALHTTYADKYHTFGLEWSEDYIFTYIDTRLLQVMYTKFDRPFWDRGNFPLQDSNGTQFLNPWPANSTSAPFDQDFYLILDVAVGGTNGWFEDGKAAKPWVDGSPTARLDFWNARAQWQPTWRQESRLAIKSVKIWQQQGYNGCQSQAVKL